MKSENEKIKMAFLENFDGSFINSDRIMYASDQGQGLIYMEGSSVIDFKSNLCTGDSFEEIPIISILETLGFLGPFNVYDHFQQAEPYLVIFNPSHIESFYPLPGEKKLEIVISCGLGVYVDLKHLPEFQPVHLK